MSEVDQAVVRRLLAAAFANRDYEGAARELHDDAKWQNTDEFPGPRCCSGRAEITAFWQTFLDAFEPEGTRIEKVTESAGVIVMQIHTCARGKASDIPVDLRWAGTFWVRDGKVARVEARGDYGKALQAAGIDPA
jgi:limonene-1,2-epoxide hydrolase